MVQSDIVSCPENGLLPILACVMQSTIRCAVGIIVLFMETIMRLNGKTALITGGNSGIGLATAQAFVQEGARVAITGRDQATLDEAAASLGPDALAFRADIMDPGSNEAAIRSAAESFGHLDIVVANAGISGNTPVGGTTAEQFERIMTTNVTGVFLTAQAAAPYLREGASVILIGSVHAVLGMPGYSAYAASKGAVRSLGRVLASELSPAGIRVNVVVPGATRTPIWTRNGRAPDTLAKMEPRVAQSVPSGRISEVEEIANTIVFLASDDATNIQGTEIVVDGGMTGSPSGAPIYRG
jgi:NAD(P)-dependent dehydrogenase (short-subunit alcohol dehydrogenase family)